uniref:MFS domain-containing protein n=1 Tax=Meloidogyne hapla TaxID=6305 RepID=A0A1I8B1E0_MELHA
MNWKLTVALVCTFGILKKFRPGTPFLTPYLRSPQFKNFTNEQIYGQIYTYWAYSNLISMIPISLCIDWLKFTPIIILEALLLFVTWSLLIFGHSIFHMQLMQICFGKFLNLFKNMTGKKSLSFKGIATSADVAYTSYLYSVVNKSKYKRVTSLIRMATMTGKFAAYSFGQFLISSSTNEKLNSLNKTDQQENEKIKETIELLEKSKKDLNKTKEIFLNKFICHYRNVNVSCWSIFAILTTCGIYLVMNYEQSLWAHRKVDKSLILNGFVEGLNTILSAICLTFLQFIKIKWENYRPFVFVGSSLVFSSLIFGMIYFGNILTDYTLYMFLYILFSVLEAVASNQIATNMHSDAYGLVFGINNFITILSITLFTFILIDKNGPLNLEIEQMFISFSIFFLSIAFLFALMEIAIRYFQKK